MNKINPSLSVQNGKIVSNRNKDVLLRGVNLGGWLMMEGYILHGRNIPESSFRDEMERVHGEKETGRFTDAFRDSFIKENDIKIISGLGFNCVRIPFNFRLIEDERNAFHYSEKGMRVLERVVQWCEKYNIYCILDMHAACGAQSAEWYADSDGKANLWKKKICQKRFYMLWQALADRFKDKEIIAGYDLLNEPVIPNAPREMLRNIYKEAVRHIRKVDRKHIIFLEGNLWARVLEDVGDPFDDNLCYSFHYFDRVDFTHNFRRGLKYPGMICGEYWNKKRIDRDLRSYYELSKKWNIPFFLGEFGINLRCEKCYGELLWLEHVLELCKEYGFHWTYWTYKTVANGIYPSGLYQCLSNHPWINCMGPVSGWENYYHLWKKRKNDIVQSWETEHFEITSPITKLLKRNLNGKSRNCRKT